MTEKARHIGPYSRPNVLAKLDRRTKIARLYDSVVSDLTAQFGGAPSATQRALIQRAAWLSLRVALLDAKIGAGEFTERDSRHYLAWSNSLTRTLARLGLESADDAEPSAALLKAMIGGMTSYLK